MPPTLRGMWSANPANHVLRWTKSDILLSETPVGSGESSGPASCMCAPCSAFTAVPFGPAVFPEKARFRSVKNAAVLTTQRTRRKDRRFYTTLTENYAAPPSGKQQQRLPRQSGPQNRDGMARNALRIMAHAVNFIVVFIVVIEYRVTVQQDSGLR